MEIRCKIQFGNQFGHPFKIPLTEIQHGKTNANWQNKYKLAG